MNKRVGLWLKNYFDHDFVFVADGSDSRSTPCSAATRRSDLVRFALPDLAPVLDYMRGAQPGPCRRGAHLRAAPDEDGPHPQAAVIRSLLGRPAVIAAVAVGPVDDTPAARRQCGADRDDGEIHRQDVLADIAAQLQLKNLRKIDSEPAPPADMTYELDGPQGNSIARFAWTPKQPGAEIVNSVIPFIAVALAGFALLAALRLRYMRRTAATIAAGRTAAALSRPARSALRPAQPQSSSASGSKR